MTTTRATALAFILLSAACTRAEAVCDNFSLQNKAAEVLRYGRDFADALKTVNAVLKKEPKNFRANYTLGLIYTDGSGIDNKAPPNDLKLAKQGTDQLTAAVGLVEAADPNCARQNNWYSVYNSAGAEYFNSDNKSEAEKYFLMGYAKRDALPLASRQKLLSNLGRLYYQTGDYTRAAKYYGEAASIGAPGAAQNRDAALELNALLAPAPRATTGGEKQKGKIKS